MDPDENLKRAVAALLANTANTTEPGPPARAASTSPTIQPEPVPLNAETDVANHIAYKYSAHREGRRLELYFRDFDLFIQHCIARPNLINGGDGNSSREDEDEPGGQSFHSFRNFNEAISAVKFGWKDGLDRIMKAKGIINLELQGIRYQDQLLMGDSGFGIDVGTYLTGEPECFIDFEPDPDAPAPMGKVVTILINMSALFDVAAHHIFMRGACVLLAYEQLVANGYSVGVTVCTQTKIGGEKLGQYIVVKEPDDYMDCDRLAFVLAASDMQRRMCFSTREQLPRWASANYGSSDKADIPASLENSKLVVIDDMVGIASRSTWNRWGNPRSALKSIIDVLEKSDAEVKLNPIAI